MAYAKNRLGRGLGALISGGLEGDEAEEASSRKTPTHTASKKSASKKAVPAKAKGTKKAVAKAKVPKQKPAKVAPVVSVKPISNSSNGTHAPAVEAAPYADKRNRYLEIPLDKIDPNPHQPRRDLSASHINELADSIRAEGLLQPIVVRERGDRFEIIAGERRWRACKEVQLKAIPARVLEVGDTSSAVLALIENLQREGLNPIEESMGYASLMRDFDLTQEAVAERVGKARASVANALRLLQLDSEIQGFLAKRMMSTGHAKVLLAIEDPAQRLILARRIVEMGMSVRDAEQAVRKLKAESASRSHLSTTRTHSTSQVIVDLERQISTRLNTKVALKHTPKRGKLIIEYYGNEDLQRILERTGLA